MILRKGYVVCQSDVDLEIRQIVEEFLELSEMSKKYVNQYVNAAKEIMDVKEMMESKKESNFFYSISLSRWFDTMTLKKKLSEINGSREASDRCLAHIERQIEYYSEVASKDEDMERAELFVNVFVNYARMYSEYLEKQSMIAKQYVIKVKQIEKVTQKDRDTIDGFKVQIVKNDKRMKMLREEIKEVWLKIPEEIMEEIVENAESEKLKIDVSSIEDKGDKSKE